jgi:hypothetical protein
MSDFRLSVKHTQSRNILLTSESNRQYYHSHYHCITCAALAMLPELGKKAFVLYLSCVTGTTALLRAIILIHI